MSAARYRVRAWTRYVAVGDSLTEGLGDPLPGGGLRGWAALLCEHIRRDQPELEFVNLAVRGHRADDALRRQLPAAVALKPDLVSVIIGANDVMLRPWLDRRRFADELDRLIAPFAGDDVTVVLATMPDLAAHIPLPPPLRRAFRDRIERANDITRAAADRYGAVLYDAWRDPRTRRTSIFSVDRIHPSTDGHQLIAASIGELLGVPAPAEDLSVARASGLSVIRRQTKEAAWLVRHGMAALPDMA